MTEIIVQDRNGRPIGRLIGGLNGLGETAASRDLRVARDSMPAAQQAREAAYAAGSRNKVFKNTLVPIKPIGGGTPTGGTPSGGDIRNTGGNTGGDFGTRGNGNTESGNFDSGNTNAGTQTGGTDAHHCPTGYTWSDELGKCYDDIGGPQKMPKDTEKNAQNKDRGNTDGKKDETNNDENKNECPSGQIKNPLTGNCTDIINNYNTPSTPTWTDYSGNNGGGSGGGSSNIVSTPETTTQVPEQPNPGTNPSVTPITPIAPIAANCAFTAFNHCWTWAEVAMATAGAAVLGYGIYYMVTKQ